MVREQFSLLESGRIINSSTLNLIGNFILGYKLFIDLNERKLIETSGKHYQCSASY